MATNNIRADTSFKYPCPRPISVTDTKSCTRPISGDISVYPQKYTQTKSSGAAVVGSAGAASGGPWRPNLLLQRCCFRVDLLEAGAALLLRVSDGVLAACALVVGGRLAPGVLATGAGERGRGRAAGDDEWGRGRAAGTHERGRRAGGDGW